MHSKRIVLGILTLITLTFAGFAIAQTTDTGADPAGMQSVTGLVVSFENNQLVVRTEDGDRTFNVLSSTTRPATLQANLPVMVSYVTESGGDRAVRVEENTTSSAASETPGGQVTGANDWPGAPSQKDVEDDNSASSGGDDTMGSTGTPSDTTAASGSAYDQSTGSTTTESGTAGSTTESGTAYTDTTGTTTATGSTGQTGSQDTMAHDSMAHDTTAANADQSAGTTTDTGSAYSGSTSGTTAGSVSDTTTTDTTTSMDDQTDTDTMAATDDQSDTSYQASESLPQTGSGMPLVGLLGLAALGAAAGIHFGRNA